MIGTFYSENYLNLLKLEHKKGKWGITGGNYVYIIDSIAHTHSFSSILDYGCGHGSLAKAFEEHKPNLYRIFEYDPGIEGKTDLPSPCELVVCIDVLEHIEEEYVDNVLEDLQRCVLKIGFFTVSLRPAVRRLSDGSNAHVTVKPADWWFEKLNKRFIVLNAEGDDEHMEFLVRSKS